MPVKFRDYYQTLGVPRTASAEEIQRAHRKLARELHPDMNKEPRAAERFQQAQEAYEVLKDPKKRARYDQLGENWKLGEEFNDGPESAGSGRKGGRNRRAARQGGPGPSTPEDFSDLYESMFGGGGPRGNPFGTGGAGWAGGMGEIGAEPSGDHEAELAVSLADAAKGATHRLTVRESDGSQRTIDVRVPAGMVDGDIIRLSGQGQPSGRNGSRGDLRLRIKLAPDPRFVVTGRDLATQVPITPWEAALGAKVPVPTLDGRATITVPPGSSSGTKLRLRGQGIPSRGDDQPGDLLVELRIVVPKELSEAEREAFRKLAEKSNFDPRRT